MDPLSKPKESMDMKETISFRLNGKPISLNVEGDRTLLWVLRTDLGLTGTKYGCGKSLCGACTVVIGKDAARSCQVAIRDVRGKEVTTIEGLAKGDKLHPLQSAFVEYGAVQCGFCTPGMIMTSKALLNENPHPTEEEIKDALSGNFCRCVSHYQVLKAVMSVAGRGK